MNTEAVSKPLTARQAEVLEFIRNNSQFFGPAVREIARGLGIKNHNAVTGHLAALERKGFIVRRPKTMRGIEVVR